MFPEGTKRAWQELRRVWLENGCPWFDPGTPRPEGWDPYAQIWEGPNTPAVTTAVTDVTSTLGQTVMTLLIGEPLRIKYA